MGTQQILMIVLSVIVVGAAIAVGIAMFDTQSKNQERSAVLMEVNNIAIQAAAWYRTPAIMRGGSDLASLISFVSMEGTISGGQGRIVTPNGTYTFRNFVLTETEQSIIIDGVSIQNSEIRMTGTIQLSGGNLQNNFGITILPSGS